MTTETIQLPEITTCSKDVQSKPDPIIQLLAITMELQELCPKDHENQTSGKYIAVDISGYASVGCRVYYGPGCSFSVRSLDDLKGKLAAYDPEKVRREKIESLRAELEKLEAK